MGNKQQVFNNMFDSLKAGGKVAVQYMSFLPLFDYNAYVLLNPENAERIFRLFHFESKTKIDRYCLSAGFEIIRIFDIHCKGPVFETVRSSSSGNGRLHAACLILHLSVKRDCKSI